MARMSVTEALAPFHLQREFEGVETLEELTFCLARAADEVVLENVDDNEWRYLVTIDGKTLAVHCHVAGDQFTVSVYEEDEPEMGTPIGHKDHWARAFLWALATAKLQNGIQFDVKSLAKNAADTAKLIPLVREGLADMVAKNKEITGEDLPERPLSIGVSRALLGDDHVGRHENSATGGVLTISPDAFKSEEYLKHVVNHELIHFLLADEDVESHGPEFHALADAVELPQEYRD